MGHIRSLIANLAAAALAAAPLALSGGCERKQALAADANAAAPVPVKLADVIVRPVPRTVEVVGTLYGDEETTISNKVPGKVIAIYHDIGDRVKPGEPLAQLLQKDYELDVQQKTMALRQALSKLGLSEIPPADFDVTTLPSVKKAWLEMENAQAKWRRGQELHDQRPPVMSDQDFADLTTAREVAKSADEVELLNARSLVSDTWTKKAELDIALQALADTTLRVPLASTRYGVTSTMPADDPALKKANREYLVTGRLGNVGELKALITSMFKLVDDNPMKLRASVPERYFTEVREGQAVAVRINAYSGRSFAGTISRKNPQVDNGSRMFPIEILIPNDEHLLPPGSFANATIQTGSDQQVVFVPQSAIVTFAGENKVFTVNNGKAEQWKLVTGERQVGPIVVNNKKESFVEVRSLFHQIEKPRDASDDTGASEDPKALKSVVITGNSKLTTGVTVTASTVPVSQPVLANSGGAQ